MLSIVARLCTQLPVVRILSNDVVAKDELPRIAQEGN